VDYTSLIDYDQTSAGNEVVLSVIADDSSSILASGVTHIRFDPTNGAINGDGGVYREIDVIQAVPEPSAFALIGLAGFGLMFRRRR